MKARLLIDMSEKLRKGDAPPKGQEARYVRAGLAEEVTETVTPATTASPAKKPARRKAKAKK